MGFKNALSVLFILFFPILVFAETGQTLHVDGYECSVSATKLSRELVVTGEVSGGDPSDFLNLTIYLVDENGLTAGVSTIIERYRGSGRFSIKKAQKRGGNRWSVESIYISN